MVLRLAWAPRCRWPHLVVGLRHGYPYSCCYKHTPKTRGLYRASSNQGPPAGAFQKALEGENPPAGSHPTGGFQNDTQVPEDAGKGWYARLHLNCCCQQLLHSIQEGRARLITSSMHSHLVGSSNVCPPVHEQSHHVSVSHLGSNNQGGGGPRHLQPTLQHMTRTAGGQCT